jgi:hypothetical protein
MSDNKLYLDKPLEKFSLYWWAISILSVIFILQAIRGFTNRVYYWDFLYLLLGFLGLSVLIIQKYFYKKYGRLYILINDQFIEWKRNYFQDKIRVNWKDMKEIIFTETHIQLICKRRHQLEIRLSSHPDINEKLVPLVNNLAVDKNILTYQRVMEYE